MPAASPFVAASSALATRAVGVLSLGAAPVLLLALLRRRWFCRWACPVGVVSETLGRLRNVRRGGSPYPPRELGGSVDSAAGAETRRAPPRRASRSRGPRLARWPAVGQWILLVTLGGACVGYPMLVWLDPLGMFTAAVGAWFRPLGRVTLLAAAPLAAVLVVSVLVPGAWCGRLCPLGGMQDVLALPARWLRRRGDAKARAAATVSNEAAEAAPRRDGGLAVGRRFFLGAGVGGMAALVTEAAGRGQAPPVRPPGAADEPRFVGLCLRCGNCVRACPTGILKPDLGEGGVAGFMTPRAVFDVGYCREDCNACGRVCPSGAIAPLPLEKKRQRTIGIAEVEVEKCVLAGGQECGVCVSACPYQAVEVVEPEEAFPAYPYPRVIAGACLGCGACEYECPTAPPRAIRVRPEAGTLSDRI
ncbi:MAG: 4Fe-4S dicluster domain-containing protein [Phycisphaerae bacterium]